MSNIIKDDNSIDWQKVKEIICDIVDRLQAVVDQLPAGLIKTLLLVIVSSLKLICDNI